MKQKKETIAFECSPHQAHLLRRYAKSIMTEEIDVEALGRKIAAQLHYVQMPPLSQLQQSQLAAGQRAAQEAQQQGGIAAMLGGLGRLW